MKAIVQDRYGSADVLALTDIAAPVVGDDDVLVRVHAAGCGVPKPARLTIEQAAAVPISGVTALQALRDKAGCGRNRRC